METLTVVYVRTNGQHIEEKFDSENALHKVAHLFSTVLEQNITSTLLIETFKDVDYAEYVSLLVNLDLNKDLYLQKHTKTSGVFSTSSTTQYFSTVWPISTILIILRRLRQTNFETSIDYLINSIVIAHEIEKMQNERDTVLSALTHSISVAYEDLLKNHVESEKVRYREHEVYEKLINRNTEIISILYDIVKKYV